jgi:hypothetical protein
MLLVLREQLIEAAVFVLHLVKDRMDIGAHGANAAAEHRLPQKAEGGHSSLPPQEGCNSLVVS